MDFGNPQKFHCKKIIKVPSPRVCSAGAITINIMNPGYLKIHV
jgi:hypothetical protein